MLDRPRLRMWLTRAAFALWVPAVLVLGAYLLGRHLAGLPAPAFTDAGLRAGLAGLRAPRDQGKWQAVHILSAECGCSQQVLSTLLARTPSSNVVEQIVFVGGDSPETSANARALGYAFVSIDQDQLAARFHTESAPLLVIADPAGQVHYAGGYTDRKRSPDVRTDELLAIALTGAHVAPLPVLGCAVSAKLRARVNPLGLL